MSKRSIVRKSDLKAGKRFWIVEYGKVLPVFIHSRTRRPESQSNFNVLARKDTYNETMIFAADLGVPGFAYDYRPPQLFFTKKAATYWMNKWADKNPNFFNTRTNTWYDRDDNVFYPSYHYDDYDYDYPDYDYA